jgi:shikimate dehydrogenase
MRRYGLIGFPLGHSFSKQYFTDKFALEGIPDAIYDNYPLGDIELFPELIDKTEDLCGLNVTIPHKTNIIKFLSVTDNDAIAVGAVNVIKITQDKGVRNLKGFNTDIYGFRESLVPHLRAESYKAIILGTGGSSLAVRYVLSSLGIKYLNVSRTPSALNIGYTGLTDKILNEYNLIINTTPIGMYPEVEFCPDINYRALNEKHILYDLIYNPRLTKFLSKGEERGCTVINGMKMLELQAEKSWSIWNNPEL